LLWKRMLSPPDAKDSEREVYKVISLVLQKAIQE